MKKYFLYALLPILALSLSGCFKKTSEKVLEKKIEKQTNGQVEIDLDGTDTKMTFEDESSGAKMEIDTTGDLDLSKEWPSEIELYNDAKLISSLTNADGMNVTMQSEKTPDEIVGWYDEAYKDWQQTASLSVAGSIMRTYDQGKFTFTVVISNQPEGVLISNTFVKNE